MATTNASSGFASWWIGGLRRWVDSYDSFLTSVIGMWWIDIDDDKQHFVGGTENKIRICFNLHHLSPFKVPFKVSLKCHLKCHLKCIKTKTILSMTEGFMKVYNSLYWISLFGKFIITGSRTYFCGLSLYRVTQIASFSFSCLICYIEFRCNTRVCLTREYV